jgi:hypothetical protein
MRSTFTASIVLLTLSTLIASAPLQAQESANQELDQCIQQETAKSALKGLALGGLAGFGKSMLSNDKDKKVAKNIAIGAAAGGVIGLVTAYYQAAGKCFAKNPSWIPESKLERSKGYEQAVKDYKYKPKQGIIVAIRDLRIANTVKAGEKLDITMTFVALTPTGAEVPVTLERKLFAVAPDGKETPLPFMGKGSEERVFEAGEHTDTASLPIPTGTAGSSFRIEYSVSVDKQAPAIRSAVVTVI